MNNNQYQNSSVLCLYTHNEHIGIYLHFFSSPLNNEQVHRYITHHKISLKYIIRSLSHNVNILIHEKSMPCSMPQRNRIYVNSIEYGRKTYQSNTYLKGICTYIQPM